MPVKTQNSRRKKILDRYHRIVSLRDDKKLSFEEIGKKLFISRQRAWQLYKRMKVRLAA